MRTWLLLSFTTFLYAQAGPPFGPRHPNHALPPIQEGPLADRLFQLRTQRFEQLLGLPHDRARSLAERWKQHDRDFVHIQSQMTPLKDQLNQILLSPSDESEKNRQIKPLIEQLQTLHTRQHDMRKQFEKDICASLTPAQQARLLLAMDSMHHEIDKLLRENKTPSSAMK